MFTRASSTPAPRMSAAETRALLDQDQAVVIDVRSPDAYANGHIAGAISVPLHRLQAALPRLPRDKTLVFY